jgi:hypothetical protein
MDDQGCEQVSMTMLSQVDPREVIERGVQSSQPWCDQGRRVRLSTALALVLLVIALGLWSRRTPCQGWNSLVGKRSSLHPAPPDRPSRD